MDLIIFHGNCPDGWCAAYVCHLKYPKAELMPLNHGLLPAAIDELFNYVAGKDVIMVDYSLRTRELNDRLNAAAKSFHIYDHHKTAQAVLDGASYAIFDMKRSGAGLAWDYLFGKDSIISDYAGGQMRPFGFQSRRWWVDFPEDQDLWNWALPDSQEINAYLMVQPRTVETWDKIIKMSEFDAKEKGEGVRSYIEYYTRSVIAEVQSGIISINGTGYKTGVLNIPYVGVSEAGSALCKAGFDIGLAWFERGDGITQFSLRSNKEAEGGGVDVSDLAKTFGGGGHRNASGFQVDIEQGRLLVDSILGRKAHVPSPRK